MSRICGIAIALCVIAFTIHASVAVHVVSAQEATVWGMSGGTYDSGGCCSGAHNEVCPPNCSGQTYNCGSQLSTGPMWCNPCGILSPCGVGEGCSVSCAKCQSGA